MEVHVCLVWLLFLVVLGEQKKKNPNDSDYVTISP